jgi:predicted nucleic acid-binding protein
VLWSTPGVDSPVGVLAALRRAGSTVAAMDLLIAAVAIVEGAGLVTANRRHFLEIPGLVVLDY